MSKLYNKYLYLKESDSSKCYLFKVGIFYIFLDADARKISEILGLKLTNLNESVVKCGFPSSTISKYINLLDAANISYQIVDENLNSVTTQKEYLSNVNATIILDTIKKADLNNLSPINAFNMICKFKNLLDGGAK